MTIETIEIVEVAPRDGLQNERQIFNTENKIMLIEKMVAAGAQRIEIASFARPDKVPQMADAEDVIAGVNLPDNVAAIGLVMNKKGLFRALETRIDEIGAICVATDEFAERNQGQKSQESVEQAMEIINLAHREGRRAQVTIGAAFGCPFTGKVNPDHVVDMARQLAQAEPIEIALADTIGVAVPIEVGHLVAAVRKAITPLPVRVHLHNTRNTGFANAWAAIQAGASTLDSSVGGIGGCPFAPSATGNIATEDLLYLLHRSGYSTSYNIDKVIDTARWLDQQLDTDIPGLLSHAGNFPQ